VSIPEAIAIFAAGIAAGTVNTIVGSGTLITFPVLIAFGYSPVVANVSNTIGLVPGSLSGAHGYRRELAGQGRRAVRLGAASVLGGITGAVLLLALPASAFKAIVPGFIALGLLLVVVQPRLSVLLAERRARRRSAAIGLPFLGALYGIGVYGGYFGAAQGILLLAVLGLSLPEGLQRVNALKNILAMLTNLVAGIVFMAVADVDWAVAGLIAAGSVIGGQLGATVGRRLPPPALRALIVAVGVVAIVKLVA
jgi:uncharacterized membrane protein YfcA